MDDISLTPVRSFPRTRGGDPAFHLFSISRATVASHTGRMDCNCGAAAQMAYEPCFSHNVTACGTPTGCCQCQSALSTAEYLPLFSFSRSVSSNSVRASSNLLRIFSVVLWKPNARAVASCRFDFRFDFHDRKPPNICYRNVRRFSFYKCAVVHILMMQTQFQCKSTIIVSTWQTI